MTKSESEIWREHPEIVGIEVSTLGRVRTLDRVVSSEKMTRFIKGRILKQFENVSGYLYAGFRINGKYVNKRLHRLVAETFIANPDNLPQVNHLDCNRKNNHVENLEFCTASYNRRYQEKFGISSTEARGHPLFAINSKTFEVSRFRSQKEAGHELGIGSSNITTVIKGKRKTVGGYWFTNADEKATDSIERKLHEIGKAELKVK